MCIRDSSDAQSIRFVQQMLIAVGLLDSGSDDGIYGSATVAAVAQFQEWYNEQTGTNTLSVTGTADYLTLQYLESAYSAGLIIGATPTPAATATATPQPTATDVYKRQGDRCCHRPDRGARFADGARDGQLRRAEEEGILLRVAC